MGLSVFFEPAFEFGDGVADGLRFDGGELFGGVGVEIDGFLRVVEEVCVASLDGVESFEVFGEGIAGDFCLACEAFLFVDVAVDILQLSGGLFGFL